jgi:N-acyl amino acid synthase of PEP-CTERM/exosortase system
MRRQLPIHRLLSSTDRLVFKAFPPYRTAEVSRFAVSKEFRRRHGEESYADAGISGRANDTVASERRLMPYVTFGLLRGVLGICLEYGVTHLAALMEPALVRILIRLGLNFERLGGLVEHHRMRQPCAACLADLVQQSRNQGSPLWQYACEEIVKRKQLPIPRAIDLWRKAGPAPPPN